MIQGTRSLPSNVRRSGSVYRVIDGKIRWFASEAAAEAGPKPTPHRDAAAKKAQRLVRHTVLEYLRHRTPPCDTAREETS